MASWKTRKVFATTFLSGNARWHFRWETVPFYPASEIEQHTDRAQTAFKAPGNTGVEVRNLKVDGGELACIDVGVYPNEEDWMKRLRSWHCESTFGARINLMGTPADVDEMWKLIEGIRVR
jgi:hypothetical protein